MAGNEIREDIVQLVVAAYDAAPDSALMADLEAIVDERGGSLLDVAAALTSGERWEERYPASWTADRFADEWLGSLLPGADAALAAAAREIVVGHLDAGGGFAELVLAAQQYLSGPDAPVRIADAARSFLDRSETAMMLSADQERAGAAAEPREALPLAAGGAGTERKVTGASADGGAMEDYDGAADDSKAEAFDAAGSTVEPREALTSTAGGAGTERKVTGAPADGGAMKDYDGDGAADDSKAEAFDAAGPTVEPREALTLTAGGAGTERKVTGAPADGGAMEDYDGDGAADDSKTEAFNAAGRPVRVEYDFNSDGTANHVETYAHTGSITTQLIEADYGGGAGTIVGDGVFDYRERRTILDDITVRILIDVDNDGTWDEFAEVLGFDGRSTYTFGAGGWLESVGLDSDSDGAYEWASTYAFTHHENGGIETSLVAFDGKTAEGLPDGAVDEVWFEGYDVDGVREFIKFDYDGDGAYDRAEFFTYTWHENGRIETKLTVRDGGAEHGSPDGAPDGRTLVTYDVDGAKESVRGDHDNDGTYEWFFTYTHHENGQLKTWLIEDDDGSGGGTAGDGVIDRRTLVKYDADGVAEFHLEDNDNDGTYEWFFTYTHHENGQLKTWLMETDREATGGTAGDGVIDRRTLVKYDADGVAEFHLEDNDGDGAYEKFYAYTYHENGKRETQLGEYDDGLGLGGGAAGDGVIDRRSLDTYDADGELVSSKQDNDGDGAYEVVSTHHEDGDVKTKVTVRDGGPGYGSPDGIVDGRTVETYGADGLIESAKQDDNNDGTHERFYAYTYHENGRIETWLIERDDGSGGGTAADGVIDRRTFVKYDADGAKESRWEDNDGDGAYERFYAYTYHENGKRETQLGEYDDGSGGGTAGDGVIDGRSLDTYDADGVIVSRRKDGDGDGIYEEVFTYHENGQLKTWLIGRDDGSGGGIVADGIIDRRSVNAYDANGVIETRKLDFDNDAIYDWIYTYTYHENGKLKTDLIEYDNGSGGGTADDGIVDRRNLHEYDDDGRKKYVKHDDDNNGVYDRINTYTHHGNGERETALFEYDDGSGGGAADDGVVDRKALDVYDASGVRRSSKYDNDNDGTWDIVDTFDWTGTVNRPDTATRAFTMGTDSTADDVVRAIRFIYGAGGPDVGTADSGAGWYELGRGDDTITGGGGRDVFVFRYGDGTDVITDFEPRVDTILIREVGFDPADVELETLVLEAGSEDEHPHIPARLFPADASTADVAVLTYGGGPDDRIIIVGGNGSEDFYRAHFLLHAGHEPDLSGVGG